ASCARGSAVRLAHMHHGVRRVVRAGSVGAVPGRTPAALAPPTAAGAARALALGVGRPVSLGFAAVVRRGLRRGIRPAGGGAGLAGPAAAAGAAGRRPPAVPLTAAGRVRRGLLGLLGLLGPLDLPGWLAVVGLLRPFAGRRRGVLVAGRGATAPRP